MFGCRQGKQGGNLNRVGWKDNKQVDTFLAESDLGVKGGERSSLFQPTWCMKAQAASTLELSTLGAPSPATPATAAAAAATTSLLPSLLHCLMPVFSMLLFSLGITACMLQGLRVAGAPHTIAN